MLRLFRVESLTIAILVILYLLWSMILPNLSFTAPIQLWRELRSLLPPHPSIIPEPFATTHIRIPL